MKRMTTVLRELLARDGAIVYCGVYDTMTAKLAEDLGFEMTGMGGNSLGSRLCISEPLLSMEDLARQTRLITSAINIPFKIDAGAGFGEPLHVMRTIRELEASGAAAIYFEDQIFPKRAHYHKGIEHVIPAEEMVVKIKAAVAARRDPDLVLIARSDAMITDSFEEGVKRANMFLEAGADVAFVYPNSVEEARNAVKEVNGHIIYGVSDGNRKGRPILTVQELEDMGYKIIFYPTTGLMSAAMRLKDMLESLRKKGTTDIDPSMSKKVQSYFARALAV